MWGLISQVKALEASQVEAYKRIKELEAIIEEGTAYVLRLERFIMKAFGHLDHYAYCADRNSDGFKPCTCGLDKIDKEYDCLLNQHNT